MSGPEQTQPEQSARPAEPATPPAPSSTSSETRERVARSLIISGVATIILAIVLGIAIDPLIYLLALVGIADFVIARLFASGRLGGTAGSPGEAAAMAESDPSYNPYAREDWARPALAARRWLIVLGVDDVLHLVGGVAHLVLHLARGLVDLALALKRLVVGEVARGLLDPALRVIEILRHHALLSSSNRGTSARSRISRPRRFETSTPAHVIYPTSPIQPLRAPSMGDRVRFRSDGPGRIVLERIDPTSNTLGADD
jgi:hypothetical protein